MFEDLFSNAGLSLDRLHTLCEVAEKGSIGEATKGNSNRQTQFSRQISELEKFFGIDILNRESRPHRLTPEGAELAGIAKDCLGRLSDFKANCSNQSVTLTIGAGESIIQWILMPMLDQWSAALPDVSIYLKNLRTSHAVNELLDGDIDLGLIRKTAVESPLKSAGNWKYGYRLFVPKKMRRNLDPKVEMKDIAHLPLAVISGSGEFRQQLDFLSRDLESPLNIQLECSSYPQIATALVGGNYCGFLPDFTMELLPPGKFTEHEIVGFERVKRELVFAWNPKKRESRKVLDQAVRFIKTQLKD